VGLLRKGERRQLAAGAPGVLGCDLVLLLDAGRDAPLQSQHALLPYDLKEMPSFITEVPVGL
jgi:hypothetical protein